MSDAAAQSERHAPGQPSLVRRLNLFDSINVIIGGVIGSAIFLTPHDIARQLPTPGVFMLVWITGGVISLTACFAFAEMGAMFPQAGGQYVYLREAFGDFVAFLYGWSYFGVIGCGSVAALSVAFSDYFGVLVPVVGTQHVIASAQGWTLTRAHLVALAVTVLLTWINIIGVKRAAVVQNIATWTKYLAMLAFVGFGFTVGRGTFDHFHASSIALPAGVPGASLSSFGVALIAVFWAYDGWVYIGHAAGEVKNPQQNIPRALIIGILCVGFIYVAMNTAYVYALGLPQIAGGEETTARAAAEALFSPAAGKWIAALVAVSCFGALSTCILSTARVSYAMAADGVFFRSMARVHPTWRTPIVALIAQGVWGALLTLSGRYDQIITYIMSTEVVTFGLAVVGLFVLRRTQPTVERPYRCTGYPVLPALYVLIAAAWAANVVWQRPTESLAGAGIVALGVPAFLYWRRSSKPSLSG